MNAKDFVSHIFLTFSSLLISPQIIIAEDVYTWTDEQGNVHYSNDANKENASKADLPQIEKQDFKEKIKDLQNLANQTCLNRGGVNCEAQKDVDGSVICMDGFTESAEMFDELCLEPRLSAEIILPPKKPNKKLSYYPIRVQVRNNTGIKAKGVTISILLLKHLSEESRYTLTLEGPQEIEPFGTLEYTYSGKNIEERILRKGNIRIHCDNCWKPVKLISK